MNMFAILSFISFLLSFSLGIYVLIKAPDKRLSVLFFVFSLFSSALCFIEYEFRMAESLDRAFFWLKIQSIWPFAVALCLHFVIQLKKTHKRKILIYSLIYIPAIILFLVDSQTNLAKGMPIRLAWGWSIQSSNNIVSYISAVWIMIILLLTVYIPYRYYLEFTGVKKKQVFFILIAFAVNLMFTLLTDVISPFFKMEIPALGNTLSVFLFSIIAYAMWKYQLFEINPNSLTGKLISTISDAIFLTNTSNEIIEVNQGALDMLNYESHELIGKKIDFIVEKTNEQDIINRNLLKLVKEKGKISDVEVNFCDKNNKLIPVSISVSVTNLNTKGRFGHIAVARDISARKIADNDLKKAFNKLDELVEERTRNLTAVNEQLIITTEKAEESDRLKTAFLANMSHEIRTPMNGILGFAGLLKKPNLSGETQNNYINIIEKSGARMLNIINDIISISKIESGLEDVSFNELNVNEQQDYLYNFFIHEAESKDLKLSYKSALPLSLSILKTDQEKFITIYTNLIKNALKYTMDGSIEFGYLKKNDFLEFYIKDTGIGVESDRQEAIFERFIQADVEDKMARQGAGLGLSITKAYVEMLGGKIWMESIKSKGSVFYFTIPYIADLVNIDYSHKEVKANISDLKVLLVEDDETSALLINIMLEETKSEILRAKNGIEAVNICRENSDLDFVLMDIRMPKMDGYEATRKIREFNKDIVIIAQTAHALAGDIEKTIDAGCNFHLSKPIIKEKMFSIMNTLFENK